MECWDDDAEQAPSQWDINEAVAITEKGDNTELRFGGKLLVSGEDAESIIQHADRSGIALRIGYPRIFAVNDHGNVTEYGWDGAVIAEWV